MKVFTITRIVSIIWLFLFILDCKKSNNPPIIHSISSPDEVSVDGSITLTCIATDPDNDPLEYAWTCTSGRLSSASGKTVIWYAPEKSGSAIISVTVYDGRGGSATRAKTITVNRLTTTLIDWEGWIPARYVFYWTKYIKSEYTVSGNFWVEDYDINFLILDAANFENWWNGRPYQYVVRILRSKGTSFSSTISHNDTYYIVLDNTYSLFTAKHAHLFVQKTSP